MKRIRNIALVGIVVVAVLGGGYYLLGSGKPAEQPSVSGQVQRVLQVGRGDLNLIVSANGVVQPINKVDIRSKASGQILELRFEEGQSVNKGDLLIALDQTQTKNDYDQAKADLALAEAAFKQSANNLKRQKELYDKKLVSQQDLDQSQTDYVRTQSQLVKAKAALSSADERLRDTRVLAPTTGVILSRSVDVGQIIASAVSNVGGGTLLANIADMEQVHVETNVDEVDIGKIKVGQRGKVVADAYPDEVFWGEVIRIAPLGKTLQNVTTFNVIILVKNTGLRLKAGMSASVDIEIFNRQGVVLVPNEALKDPHSEQGRVLLASLNPAGEKPKEERPDSAKADTSKASVASKNGGQEDPQAMRERLQKMSPEERQKEFQKMRERFQNMSPEERDKMGQRFGGQRAQNGQRGNRGEGGGQGQGGGSPMFGDNSGRPKRSSQIGNIDEVKERIVMVKEGDKFVPRLIKVGASNFENSEVMSGLNEGDEIQVTTISRAKLASQQMNDRMKSMNSMGGLGGSGAAGGGGRGR